MRARCPWLDCKYVGLLSCFQRSEEELRREWPVKIGCFATVEKYLGYGLSALDNYKNVEQIGWCPKCQGTVCLINGKVEIA